MNDHALVLVSAALLSHLLLQQQPASRLRLHVCGLACALSIVFGVTGGQLLERLLVVPWQLQNLRLFLLLPWMALLAWGVTRALARLRPDWPTADLAWPIVTNALLLGLALQVIGEHRGWLATLGYGSVAGMGFWLALVLFADLMQRCEHPDVPNALRGLPVTLLCAGVMALAISGLNGLLGQ